MGCTTILVGKDASYDGSTLVARNEDSANGEWNPKRVTVVRPEDQPRHYTSVIGHLTIDLPNDPMRYTATPNAVDTEGIWGAAGINAANVAMSATETLTTNQRVRGADPFVERQGDQPGGIGEEDFLTLVLPYIRSAREGVLRLGALLERYGTYEMNGVAFSDVDEIWWLETVGGHHWIARRVPDDRYVTMPNQLGIDSFDLDDAEGAGREYLASADLRSFINEHHLDLALAPSSVINPREVFGSHTDSDHVYNTPRAWDMQRRLNPSSADFTGTAPRLSPTSDDIPWSRIPERKLTIEDVKDVLSAHYQGTGYDPYSPLGTEAQRHLYRPIGINRHSQLSVLQIRPYRPEASRAIQWVAFASNPFNTLVPLFTNVETVPGYLESTTGRVTTDTLYWSSRIIAALADAHFADAIPEVERYQEKTGAIGHFAVARADDQVSALEGSAVSEALATANERLAEQIRTETDALLSAVLVVASNGMHNRFSRSDN
ncbi:C69 family dipeptidase [Propionimicrobium sp. PCR01-08-3]|uniref:C69 family dipeptidase n=1 Tax=Propionimicrobium sp. PCR01-08-3 TaxID=3052086 RepID=UPI00255C8340|nr:C69 family dipeptidase [Propionimicrobium sp. PCR01-08-3]WIY82914.1 C69 family dipeptidase [Propionimicrobium sp. PCR01-08-3]